MAGIRLLALALATLGVIATPASAAPKSKVRFTPSAVQVAEDGGSATVSLTRTRQLGSPATVHVTTADGTATAGADYTARAETVTFPAAAPGVKSQTASIDVPIADDSALESPETVALSLKAVSGVNGGGAATLTILDDDGGPRISFASATANAAENSGDVQIALGRSGDITAPASVHWGVTGGTASAGDYDAPGGTVEFATGEFLKTITVGLNDNDALEGARNVVISLDSPVGAELIEPFATTVTIIDDDSPAQLRFEVANVSAAEGDGTALLTVTRAGSYTGETVSVALATADGSALDGSDYTGFADVVTLEGPDPQVEGDTGEESATIEIPIADDDLEEAAETLTATLSDVTGPAVLGTPDTATVTIAANDAPVVEEKPPGQPGGGTTTTTPPPPSPGGSEQSLLGVSAKILRKKLRKRGVRLRLLCTRACTITARARVRGKKVVRLRKALPRHAAGTTVRTRLRLKRSALRRLGTRKRYRVTVVLRATADDGSVVRVKRTVRIRR